MSDPIRRAIEERDEHVRQILDWHFNPATGCRFWLSQVDKLGFDPREKVKGFDDLVEHFPNFNGDKYLRSVPMEDWIPKGIGDLPCSRYVTGGTLGDPKQRLDVRDTDSELSDIAADYKKFASYLPREGFQQGGKWLYIGPQGPRRLKRGVETMARLHGAHFVEVDMDVAWMKSDNNSAQAAYKRELVDRAIGALRRDRPDKVFCPPILIQAIGAQYFDWSTSGVKGIFAGGTEMTAEDIRFMYEELFRRQIIIIPTYGNALVGLARPRPFATFDNPIQGQDPYQVIYQPLQPRTLLRVTKKGDPKSLVSYGEFGYVEITTMTKMWFMPRFLERDWAKRIPSTEQYPWDGVAEVQLPPELKGKVGVGVY